MFALSMEPVFAEDAFETDANAALKQLYASEPAAKIVGEKAKAVLVPNIVKAGFIVGRQYGEGILFVNGKFVPTIRLRLPTACSPACKSGALLSPCSCWANGQPGCKTKGQLRRWSRSFRVPTHDPTSRAGTVVADHKKSTTAPARRHSSASSQQPHGEDRE
jgi:hypothetical protein